MLDNKLNSLKEELAQTEVKLSQLQTADFEELETTKIRLIWWRYMNNCMMLMIMFRRQLLML